MVLSFDLDQLLEEGMLEGVFAVQNKDPDKNPELTVPDGGVFEILLEQLVDGDWQMVTVDCTPDPLGFKPSLVDLSDDGGFRKVWFSCLLVDVDYIDDDAKSVRVTAIVPLDGRFFLSRLSQKIF